MTQVAEYQPPEKKKICPVCLKQVDMMCTEHNMAGVDSAHFSSDSPLHRRRYLRPAPERNVMSSDDFQKTDEYITHQKNTDVETF